MGEIIERAMTDRGVGAEVETYRRYSADTSPDVLADRERRVRAHLIRIRSDPRWRGEDVRAQRRRTETRGRKRRRRLVS